eukprot:TRINITY_DN1033_c0_g1_i6.p1 TRINITY_DN1033_c0_g1~~TRINITY_DN1033_c0_g1_i6.p1  ORF type:complete len:544 (-),score=50.12 TRINITY_DN1033_c0_g1_i6:325-1956(-)
MYLLSAVLGLVAGILSTTNIHKFKHLYSTRDEDVAAALKRNEISALVLLVLALILVTALQFVWIIKGTLWKRLLLTGLSALPLVGAYAAAIIIALTLLAKKCSLDKYYCCYCGKSSNMAFWVACYVAAGASFCSFIVHSACAGFAFRKRNKQDGNQLDGKEANHASAATVRQGKDSLEVQDIPTAAALSYGGFRRYQEQALLASTDNLSSKFLLGTGGFGRVYKCQNADGSIVALKVLDNPLKVYGNESQFAGEAQVMSSIKHKHLVNLLGYATTSTMEFILVLEYCNGGNLYEALHGGVPQLDWLSRMRIAVGAAQALAYLHHGVKPPLVHRDMKAANILLDQDSDAKVADFGLAKNIQGQATHVSTRIAGTLGYMAPEYSTSGQLTTMSDVYSFGMVLLEILTGKDVIVRNTRGMTENLANWVTDLMPDIHKIVDPGLKNLWPREVVAEFIELVLRCTTLHRPMERPTMKEVAYKLEMLHDKSVDAANGPQSFLIPTAPPMRLSSGDSFGIPGNSYTSMERSSGSPLGSFVAPMTQIQIGR